MTTLLIATRNAHKVAEIRTLLGEKIRCLTLREFPDAPPVIEDSATFAGNAMKKALELANWLNIQHLTFNSEHPRPDGILADDSGLEVDALNGAPGVHSARFAALDNNENSPDADNNAKLLRLLKDVPPEKRTARFRCVIALVEINQQSPIPNPQLFEGTCAGRIAFAPRGANGFGYDPLFVPAGFEQTFAELGDRVKNDFSHRAKALAELRAKMAW